MLKPAHASHIIHMATQKNFTDQIYNELQKNIFLYCLNHKLFDFYVYTWYLYPTKEGYHALLVALMKEGKTDKVWKTVQLMAERGINANIDKTNKTH